MSHSIDIKAGQNKKNEGRREGTAELECNSPESQPTRVSRLRVSGTDTGMTDSAPQWLVGTAALGLLSG